ncbi:CocE/NonD family hydrolase [Herbaspirillum sp. GCM10030257]|uniref:CocE/NonD family hydrolase n=1 Tax=Herbaspirillum sp. GCM10030257 TaxID=3273393 RepID=UPI003618E5BC
MRNVMVKMRDGICLATDVYLPERNGEPVPSQFPVILERTPYGKHLRSRSEVSIADQEAMERDEVAAYFVRAGYVVVYQDCRGRYASEGSFVKYTSDGNDGYDTCAWILQQEWCNGRIGTMGLSYAAHTQAALGSMNAPGIVAMFMDSGGFSNAYQGGIRQGGAFELKQATWAIRQALESPAIRADDQKRTAFQRLDIHSWFNRIFEWKPGDSPLALAPEYENYLFDQWQRGSFDDYWRQVGLYAEGFHTAFCDAAMVLMSSWYDPYPRTATENYIGLSKAKKGPICLILGPWTHGNRSLSFAGDVDFGAAATLDNNLADNFLALRRQWFDRWLKGDSEEESMPKVRIFVMGGGSGRRNTDGRLDHGGRWRNEEGWPIKDAVETAYYLQRDGSLSASPPNLAIAVRGYNYDPLRPVPTIGGAVTSGEPLMFGGAFDQREGPEIFGAKEPYRPLSMRPDVLVFETEPLEEDVEVTGPVAAHLWISSDCLDTDFTIKLIDVYPCSADYPKGYAMNLTDGILRTRYRESWETPSMMTPGEVYKIHIEAFPTSNLFKKGHRIRVDVSSSNFPKFDCNPNTGDPEGVSGEVRVASNRVYMDSNRPSHVVLPIVSRPRS